jgi:hypothetical protein
VQQAENKRARDQCGERLSDDPAALPSHAAELGSICGNAKVDASYGKSG